MEKVKKICDSKGISVKKVKTFAKVKKNCGDSNGISVKKVFPQKVGFPYSSVVGGLHLVLLFVKTRIMKLYL